MRFLKLVFLLSLIGLGAYFSTTYLLKRYQPSSFIPEIGSPEARAAVFAAEFAKHPDFPGCAAFTERYVETNGLRAIWYIECSDGILVAFYFDEKGDLAGAKVVGGPKSEEE